MIDWTSVENALARLAHSAPPGRLLSVTLPLPHWPTVTLPAAGDWCCWQRPDRALRLLGSGKAFAAHSAGAGRFAALHAAQRGLCEGWRYSSEMPRAFVGFAFASESPAEENPLPNASLWVPELLLTERGDQIRLTLSCAAGQARKALPRWRALWREWTKKTAVLPAPTFGAQANPLADQAFLARARAAIAAIAGGTADKLVLTRSLRLQGSAPLAADALLATLAAQHPACATFGVGQAGKSFIGASPETLLALDGAQVAVDALAGTAWQASALALGADKNRREHDFVALAVADALAELCDDVAVPEAPEVMRLNALSHLRCRVTGRRPADVAIFDLIARLHPTPAVGGTPTPAALDWLARHGDRRGAWYAGGIGWLDAAGDCDIAVALRCGLFEGNVATLYAGAGFVAGSDPEQELAETEVKLAAMREALAAACVRAGQVAA